MRGNSKVYFVAAFFIFLAVLLFIFVKPTFTGLAIFEDSGEDFEQGTYENTFSNGSAVLLSGENLTGSYFSRVFDAERESVWNSMEWEVSKETPIFARVCDNFECAGEAWNAILFDSPSNLNLENKRYFQYRVDFERESVEEEVYFSLMLIDYTPKLILPKINVTDPDNGAVYGYNDSVPIDLEVYDADYCWYVLDEEEPVEIENCESTNFSTSEGLHTIIIYANNTEGESNKTIQFTINVDAPTVRLLDPPNEYYSNESDNEFTYFVEDEDLDYCEFSNTFSGAWAVSSTEDEPFNGMINSFSASAIGEGEFEWAFDCYDSVGNNGKTLERIIIIDESAPEVNILKPAGVYSSRKGIPIELEIVDSSPLTCTYKLTRQFSSEPVLIVVMPTCESTSLNVDKTGDYILEVTVVDAAGNSQTQEKEFSVSGQNDGGSSGSSGGGGGGSGINPPNLFKPELQYEEANVLSIRPGFSEEMSVTLLNAGNRFLNVCGVFGAEGFEEWVASSQVGPIGPGERKEYSVLISVPREQRSGGTSVILKAKCNEIEGEIPITIIVIPADFEFNVISYEVEKIQMKVIYGLRDLTGEGSNVLIEYRIVNSVGNILKRGTERTSVSPSTFEEKILLIELPKDSFGELSLVFEVSTENDRIVFEQEFFVPSSFVTGLAISEANRKTLSVLGVALIIAGAVAGTFYFKRRYWKTRRHKKIKK